MEAVHATKLEYGLNTIKMAARGTSAQEIGSAKPLKLFYELLKRMYRKFEATRWRNARKVFLAIIGKLHTRSQSLDA